MQTIGMVLCVHGEVTDPDVDVFDREAVFIERVLKPLVRTSRRSRSSSSTSPPPRPPISSREAGRTSPRRSRRSTSSSTAMPCSRRPAAARILPAGRQARGAPPRGAQGGDIGLAQGLPRHRQRAPPREAKEVACGCAGIFNAPFALESYATVFEEEGALDRFEAFASENGPRFYGLPLNEGRSRWSAPSTRCPTRSTASCRSTPARRSRWKLAGLAVAFPLPLGADHGREMLLQPLITFAGSGV